MKWVTRERVKVERVACPWLIKKFIDPRAEFLFVPREQVLAVAEREGAIPFDAPGVELGHHEGRCSFEAIIEKYHLIDPALLMLAEIVHAADIPADLDRAPQAAGLRAIAEGFHLLGLDDHQLLQLEFPIYDALYAWCQAQVADKTR